MNKMKTANLILILIGVLFFVSGMCCGQVEVMHFNSEWNKSNDYDVSNLKDCKTQNVIICHEPKLKEKYKIVSVPTIIIFDEGFEVVRFVANIMMQLEIKDKEVQKEIDKIYLKKFE
tara:strand:+ start:1741 stop:2091 length:351 start_codon:yes stop_codon:yes gene_type:complete